MLNLLEREAARKVAVTAINLSASWVVAHLSGRFGITLDQSALTAALFSGAEYVRHLVAIRYPWAAQWIS